MKVEIEIDEDLIKRTIIDLSKKQITSYLNDYTVERNIRNKIDEYGKDIIEEIIKEELKNIPAIREVVKLKLENKIRMQLTKIMNEVE
jgi:hypothetical protein